MDFRDSPEEAAFRDRLRAWLSEQKGKFPTSGDEYWAAQGAWHQALYEAGFFGTSWPKEFGGQDLPPVYDVIVDEEIVMFAIEDPIAGRTDLTILVIEHKQLAKLVKIAFETSRK